MMTREENICQSCAHSKVCKSNDGKSSEYCNQYLALSALRPVSREQVEKGWRGEWKYPGYYDDGGSFVHDCSKCNTPSTDEYWFCPFCGAPMTGEAVQMVMERMEELYGE